MLHAPEVLVRSMSMPQNLDLVLARPGTDPGPGRVPRRSDASARGYDGLGIVVVDAPNDGTPVRLVTGEPAPQPGDNLHYDSMLRRVAGEYDATFRRI